MIVALLLGLALGEPCTSELVPPTGDTVSLAWVKPSGRGLSGTVRAVETVALRGWLARHPEADVSRLVRGLGLRKRAVRGSWDVVIVEAEASELCRPLPEGSPGSVEGVTTCTRPDGDLACGKALDHGDAGRPSLQVFEFSWTTVSARGHCVLPAERFLREVR